MPPFVAKLGSAIRSNVGTILQLDDEDDEARQALERRSAAEIESALQVQRDAILGRDPGGEGYPASIEDVPKRLSRGSGRVTLALEQALAAGADLGVKMAVKGLESVGLAFNYRLVNAFARTWARDYSYELIRGINQTSLVQTQLLLEEWTLGPRTLGELEAALADVFGPERAMRIATTETTRAFAEGTIRSYQQAGFTDGRPEVLIPLHPVCRCRYSLEILDDGSAYWIFNTSLQDVCPQCMQYEGQRVGLARRAR